MRRLLLVLIVLLLAAVVAFGQEDGTTYVVQPGDTLARIATRFGVTAQAIADANNIANPDLIFAGQVLVIPVTPTGAPTGTPAATSAATLPPTPAPSGTPTTSGTPAPELTVEPQPELTAEAQAAPVVEFQLGGAVTSFAYPELMRRASMTWAGSRLHWTMGAGAEIAQGAIDAARANGFRILLSIAGDPAEWAADPAAYNRAFADFLGAVALLSPDAIEVWNGQNLAGGWAENQVSAAAYTDMLTAAYAAIKASNPNVLVISGAPLPTPLFANCSTSGCEDSAYLEQMAAAGAGDAADCIGVQYVFGALPPDATSGDSRMSHHSYYYQTLIDTYAAIFPAEPLCLTRIGYLSDDGLGALPTGYEWADSTSLSEQAEWLAQAALMARQSGRVELFMVWNVDSTVYDADPQAGYAIVRADGECIACIALNAAMRMR